eukprot:12219208-Heterocapsa_arctica.AAC.1
MALLSRGAMSVPRACYSFVQAGFSVPTRVWESAQYELTIMSSLLPLVVADLRRPWNPKLHMTDAAPHGHCTCTKQSDPGTIRSLAE